ncbi:MULTISPECIES: hypothetical protein [unclassified Breznakia]|uniref:hypothetical protein n=1 Tax=unclassified Breznakia TaxID=2623764 RepID=UPI0024050F91|nr:MULTISPECIES: hypothetical protein [unclassified Breznakia]MDF9837353.1 hypothetical protein [Breznakia sp. PFB2-8]MDF9859288.1 hypothetical protein [Breznakia sp. PH5-24]
MDKKKHREKEILNKIYQDEEYSIIPDERPDFLLCAKDGVDKFGVEITELYISQERAKHFNKHIQQEKSVNLSAENDFLKVYTRLPNTSSWNLFSVEEVSSDIPGFEEYKNKIIQIIEDKTRKSLNYYEDLVYLELVIEDCERYFKYADVRFFKLLSNDYNLQKAITASAFKRVYILSEYNDQELLMVLEGHEDE